jgi:hypothetical protein
MHYSNEFCSSKVRATVQAVGRLTAIAVISDAFGSPLSESRHKCRMLIDAFRLILSEGQSCEDWKPYNKAKHSYIKM